MPWSLAPRQAQNRISLKAVLFGKKRMIADITAARKAFTATPASSSVAIENRPPTAAMP